MGGAHGRRVPSQGQVCLASPHLDVDYPAQTYMGKVQTRQVVDLVADTGVVDTSLSFSSQS